MKLKDRIYLKHLDEYATLIDIESNTHARVTLEENSWTIRVNLKDISPIRKDKLNLL